MSDETFEAFVRRVAPEHAPLILAELERLRQELRIARFDAVVPVRELREENERLREEHRAVLDCVNLYGDETLHAALDAVGWVPRDP